MHQRNHCQLETLRATAIPMMAAAAEATSAVPPTKATPRRPSDRWEGIDHWVLCDWVLCDWVLCDWVLCDWVLCDDCYLNVCVHN